MSTLNWTDPIAAIGTIGENVNLSAGRRGEVTSASREIVRSLCHDMRQPLAALRVLAESVEALDENAMRSMVEEIAWLTLLVESVLGEPTEPGLGEFWLGEVALAAVQLEHAQCPCDIRLTVRHAVRLRGRPVALQRALLCLLDNAARAAGARGHVDVDVACEGSHALLTVADDGPGLGNLGRQHSLGLATVRAIIADVGGHFSLVNRGGKGAVATIRVPALPAVATT